MRDLIEEYKETRWECRKMAGRAEGKEDKAQWNAMGNHADFVVRWLETGRQPGNVRGVERRAAYEREVLVDPTTFNFDYYLDPEEADEVIDEADEETLDLFFDEIFDEILDQLTEREREVWEMRKVGMMSQDEIAQIVGISRQRVSTLIKSAGRKIEDWRNL